MLSARDRLHGLSTTPAMGRQRPVADVEAAIREKSQILTRAYKRDARLLVAVPLLTVGLLGSVGVNVWQSRTGIQVEPYVVMVDHVGNEAPVLRLAERPVTPEQSVILGVLIQWVELVRMVSSDPVVLGKNWDKLATYTSNAAFQRLQAWKAVQQARQERGWRVDITVPSVLPIGAKSRSYTAEWDETVYDLDGRVLPSESRRWTATLTIADFQSAAAQQQRDLQRAERNFRNILGIVVDDFSWKDRPLYLQAVVPTEGS